MQTHTMDEIQTWRGQDAMGRDGDKLGSIEDIYLDEQTGKPEWVAIKTGLFGTKLSFAPLAEARHEDGGIHLPYDKATLKDAPNVDADGQLSQEEEQRLYAHYGLDYGEQRSDTGLPEGQRHSRDTGRTDRDMSTTTGREPVGHDTSGPTTDEAMTRSEEELTVGKTSRETGRARLRKYVVTEEVQQTVPVQREEVRIEREPITDANAGAALDGPAISEEEHEVTLHAEEPVVEKRVVPKERVRLDKETVAEERTVTDEVRKERIEADGEAGGRL